MIGSSSERSSTPAVAGPTCQTRMKCRIISSVRPRRRRLDDVVPELGEQLGRGVGGGGAVGSTGTGDGGAVVTAIRRRPGALVASARYGRSGRRRDVEVTRLVAAHDVEQRGRIAHRARDRARRASPSEPDTNGAGETRPRDGLIPKSPQHEAGMRIEPPPSLPWATGTSPAATAEAAPPLEPPGVRDVSHGLRQSPFSSDSVIAIVPNSGVFVLPMITKPASRILRHHRRVEVRHVLGEGLARVGGADARGLVEVLDRDRDAVKRPVCAAPPARRRPSRRNSAWDRDARFARGRARSAPRATPRVRARALRGRVRTRTRALRSTVAGHVRPLCRRRTRPGPAFPQDAQSDSASTTRSSPGMPSSSSRARHRRTMPGAAP